jgi:hypothetical protein
MKTYTHFCARVIQAATKPRPGILVMTSLGDRWQTQTRGIHDSDVIDPIHKCQILAVDPKLLCCAYIYQTL